MNVINQHVSCVIINRFMIALHFIAFDIFLLIIPGIEGTSSSFSDGMCTHFNHIFITHVTDEIEMHSLLKYPIS